MGQRARLLPHRSTVRLVLLVAVAFALPAASADARALTAAPPAVSLAEPSDGSVTNSPGFSGTAGTAAGDVSTVTVRVYAGASPAGTPVATLAADVDQGGGFWSASLEDPLSDGTYTAQAEQIGADGTGVSDANTFRVDTTGPAVTLVQPVDGAETADTTPTFSGTAGNAIGDEDSVRVRVFGDTADEEFAATRVGTAWSVTPGATQALAPGTYSVVAEQFDDAFNTGTSATHTLTISGPPAVSIGSPADGQTLQDSLPLFSGRGGGRDDDDETVTVVLWQGEDTSGAPFRTLTATREGAFWEVRPSTPLPNGLYSARARQDSADGQGISEVVSFTIAAPAELASAGPLTRIRTSPDLGCAVNHVQDSSGEFFNDFACGTLVVVDGTLFGPASIPAGGSAGPRTPFTPVSQTVGGTGTATDPLTIVSVADAGTTGVRITQRDTYVIGEESYRTEASLANTGGTSRAVKLYRAADCYLQDSDAGFGEVDPATGAVACTTPPDPITGNARIEQWFPLSPGSHYMEAGYSQVWAQIGAQLDFDDTCLCDAHIDNGAGLSWSLTLAAGNTASRAHLTTFSPLGRQPLTMSKTADAASTLTGGENGYTITIRNSGDLPVTLASVTDDLPAGFAYVPGTTTGATTANPSIAGRTLTWSDVAVPANGEVTIHFRVTVSDAPGEYRNEADGVATGPAVVVGTGPTAPVTVVADTTPPALTLDTPAHGSSTTDTTPTFSGAAGTASRDSMTVTVDVYSGTQPTGVPVQALAATRDAGTGAYSVDAPTALAPGTYTARARQDDSAGNTGLSTANTFTITEGGTRLTVIKRVVNDDGGTKAAGAFTVHVKSAGVDVTGSPQPGSAEGTTYELQDGQRYFVSEDDAPGYVRTFSGDCASDGSIVLELNEHKTCTITNNDVAVVPPGDCLEFADFSPATGMQLLGSAGIAGNALRLTPALGDQAGFAWYGARVPVSGSFTSDFQFSLTEAAGLGGGADGLTFAIQNAGVVATAALGGGLGYDGLPNSVVVEFDTYDNGLSFGDPNDNHVAVHTRGSEPNGPAEDSLLGAAPLTPVLKDGEIHHARVVYAGGELSVYVDDLTTPALAVPIDLAQRLDLTEGRAFAGFTAATGSGVENHDVLDWSLCPDATPPQTGTLTVVKHVVNDDRGTASASDFTMHIRSGGTDVAGKSPFPGAEAPGTTRTLSAGTYTVAESGGPAEYAATISGDCAPGGTVTLAAGQSKTCTITNDDSEPAPVVTLEQPADGAVTNDATPAFAGTAQGGTGNVTVKVYEGSTTGGALVDTLTATVGAGGAWSVSPTSGLADGTYTAQAEQSGAGGVGRSARHTFRIDTTAPAVTLGALPEWTNDATPAFAGAAGDAAGDSATVVLTLEGNSGTRQFNVTRAGAAWTLTPLILADGTYTARATQLDAAGNAGQSVARTFTVDTVAPQVTVASPADGARTNDTTPALSGAAGNAVGDEATVTLTLGGGAPQEIVVDRAAAAWSSTAPSLPDGAHEIRATQRDLAGNIGTSATHDFTVDTTGPAVNITAPANGVTTAGGAVTFAGGAGAAVGDASAIVVRVFAGAGTGGAMVQTLTATRSGASWSVGASPALAPGIYTVQAEQADSVGNVGRSGAHTFTVPGPVLDDVGEIDVPKGVKRSHLFCKRARGCKGLVGSAEFRDRGKAIWKLTVTYRRNGRTKTATVATLTQRVNAPGTKEFKLTAIGKQALLNKLSGAQNVKLTLTLTFTDRDGNRTVRTMPVKLKR